jgi:hypothetical protein
MSIFFSSLLTGNNVPACCKVIIPGTLSWQLGSYLREIEAIHEGTMRIQSIPALFFSGNLIRPGMVCVHNK